MAGLTVLGLAAVTALSLYGVNRQVAETETIVQVDAAQVDVALKSQVSLAEAVRAYKNYLVRKDDKHVTGFRESIGTFEKTSPNSRNWPTPMGKRPRSARQRKSWASTGDASMNW